MEKREKGHSLRDSFSERFLVKSCVYQKEMEGALTSSSVCKQLNSPFISVHMHTVHSLTICEMSWYIGRRLWGHFSTVPRR
jgi:hypothetical protein